MYQNINIPTPITIAVKKSDPIMLESKGLMRDGYLDV